MRKFRQAPEVEAAKIAADAPRESASIQASAMKWAAVVASVTTVVVTLAPGLFGFAGNVVAALVAVRARADVPVESGNPNTVPPPDTPSPSKALDRQRWLVLVERYAGQRLRLDCFSYPVEQDRLNCENEKLRALYVIEEARSATQAEVTQQLITSVPSPR